MKKGRPVFPRGFSLMELLIVIAVIGILSALTLPLFTKTREAALDKEAISMLKRIREAERMYRLETATYYASSDIANINTNLKLMLYDHANRAWNYQTYNTGCACATRISDNRKWYIETNTARPLFNEEPQIGSCT